MLDCITSLNDPRVIIIKDDPVRPNIAIEHRINERAGIYLWTQEAVIKAAVCVSYCDAVPHSEVSMLLPQPGERSVAVAYTIWSYSSGAARELIMAVRDQMPVNIKKMVTLSPQTEMARRFHLSNGAVLIRANADTWNFEYSLAHCVNRNPGPRCEAA